MNPSSPFSLLDCTGERDHLIFYDGSSTNDPVLAKVIALSHPFNLINSVLTFFILSFLSHKKSFAVVIGCQKLCRGNYRLRCFVVIASFN
jgi:hypothetical protein